MVKDRERELAEINMRQMLAERAGGEVSYCLRHISYFNFFLYLKEHFILFFIVIHFYEKRMES